MDDGHRTPTRLWDIDPDSLRCIFEHLGAKDMTYLAAVNFVPGLIVDTLRRRVPGALICNEHAISPSLRVLRVDAARLANLEWRRDAARMPIAACSQCCTFVSKHAQLSKKLRDFNAELGQRRWVYSQEDGTFVPVKSRQEPSRVIGADCVQFRSVYYNNNIYAAVSTSGQLYTWSGDNIPARVLAVQKIRILSIAIGNSHTLAVDEDGAVFSWGEDRGQLGYDVRTRHPSVSSSASSPSVASAPLSSAASVPSSSSTPRTRRRWIQKQPRLIHSLRGVIARSVSAGNNHSMVVTQEGDLFTFGSQYGTCPAYKPLLPEKIDASPLRNLRITSSAAGDYHSLAVTQMGMVLSWGFENGQLGRPRKGRLPQRAGRITREISYIPSLQDVCRVASSLNTSCAVTTDGRLFVWGKHSGDYRPFSRAPMLVDAIRDHFVVAVSINRDHVVVVTGDDCVIGMDLVHALSPKRRFAIYVQPGRV